jgi:hypothetical protein
MEEEAGGICDERSMPGLEEGRTGVLCGAGSIVLLALGLVSRQQGSWLAHYTHERLCCF